MKIDPNNPRSFYLSKEENQKVFNKIIIPSVNKDFDFSFNETPTVYLTAGLPGAGKSSLVVKMLEESENNKTFIANSDEMRPYHPKFKEAVEIFGSNAGAAIHKDATIFSEKLIKYAQKKQANFIIDGTLKDPKKAEELITSLQNHKYNIKVTMIAVNEYESLQGVYNRYAKQYEDNPTTARFVDPKFIMIGKPAIIESAEILHKKNINEFKIVDRNHKLLYNSKIDKNQLPSEIIKISTDLKNWNQEKINQIKKDWDKLIVTLKEVKVPITIVQSAKEIQKNMNNEIKELSLVLNKEFLELSEKIKKANIHLKKQKVGENNLEIHSKKRLILGNIYFITQLDLERKKEHLQNYVNNIERILKKDTNLIKKNIDNYFKILENNSIKGREKQQVHFTKEPVFKIKINVFNTWKKDFNDYLKILDKNINKELEKIQEKRIQLREKINKHSEINKQKNNNFQNKGKNTQKGFRR